MGASEYLAAIHGIVAGKPPEVDYNLERRVQATCREGIRQGWVRSAHDSAEGGIAVALAECCISGNLGAEIRLNIGSEASLRWDNLLFGEGGARILVSVAQDRSETWESYLQEQLGDYWQKIGQVVNADTHLRVITADDRSLIDVSITNVRELFLNAIERRLAI